MWQSTIPAAGALSTKHMDNLTADVYTPHFMVIPGIARFLFIDGQSPRKQVYPRQKVFLPFRPKPRFKLRLEGHLSRVSSISSKISLDRYLRVVQVTRYRVCISDVKGSNSTGNGRCCDRTRPPS